MSDSLNCFDAQRASNGHLTWHNRCFRHFCVQTVFDTFCPAFNETGKWVTGLGAAAADEAKKIAWLASARANGDVSEEELQAVEEELDAIGQAWRAKSGSLKERMRGASSARQKALSQQMAYLGTSLFSVFGKVGDLISVPPCAS